MPAGEGLELVRPDLELAGHERAGLDAGGCALAPADHRLHACEHLLGVAGLGHPVVGAGPEPANPLRDAGAPGAHHHAEPGKRRPSAIEEVPGLLVQEGEVHHQRVHAHGHELLHRGGASSRRCCHPRSSARLIRTRTNPESESRIASRRGPASEAVIYGQCTHACQRNPCRFTAFSQVGNARVTDFPHLPGIFVGNGGRRTAPGRDPAADGDRDPPARVRGARAAAGRWSSPSGSSPCSPPWWSAAAG